MKNIRLILTVCVLAMVLLFADLAWADTAPEETAYTVDFYYGEAEYHLPGGGSMLLSRLLSELNIPYGAAEITALSFTDDTLLSITPESGDYLLTSLRAFDSAEKLEIAFADDAFIISVADNYKRYNETVPFDDRVIQGENESNFTSTMPIATIYVDEGIVNQNLYKVTQDVKAELLVSEDSGLKIKETGTAYGQLYYDMKNGPTLTYNVANNINTFDGPIVRYTIKNAAQVFNEVTKEYEPADIVITYSNLKISLQRNLLNYSNLKELNLFDTNRIYPYFSGSSVSTSDNHRAGIIVDVNVKIVQNETPVDGTFYFPMTDIDVSRTSVSAFSNLYNAGAYNNYSEQIMLIDNYEGRIWIPGGDYNDEDPVTNENIPYLAKIIDKDGNLFIFPQTQYQDVGLRRDKDYYTGFITLADNTSGGINFRSWSTAAAYNGVESYILTGQSPISHKIAASTDEGGRIATTSTGNPTGDLLSGTIIESESPAIGSGTHGTPKVLATAKSQTIRYTMTPEKGYRLKNIYISNDSIKVLEELDEHQPIDIANINSNLRKNPDGSYVYTFSEIDSDNSIHVEWEPIPFTVNKEIVGAEHDEFKFRIALQPIDEMVTYKIKAGQTVNVFVPVTKESGPSYLAYSPKDDVFMGWDFTNNKWKSISMADATLNYTFTNDYLWTLRDNIGELSDTYSVADPSKRMQRLSDSLGKGHLIIVDNKPSGSGYFNNINNYLVQLRADGQFYWMEPNVSYSIDYSPIEYYTYTPEPVTENSYDGVSWSDGNGNSYNYQKLAGERNTYIITVPQNITSEQILPNIPPEYRNNVIERIEPAPFDLDEHMRSKGLTPVAANTYEFTINSAENGGKKELDGLIPYGWTYTIWEVDKDGKAVELNKTFLAEGNKQWRLTKEENVQGTMGAVDRTHQHHCGKEMVRRQQQGRHPSRGCHGGAAGEWRGHRQNVDPQCGQCLGRRV